MVIEKVKTTGGCNRKEKDQQQGKGEGGRGKKNLVGDGKGRPFDSSTGVGRQTSFRHINKNGGKEEKEGRQGGRPIYNRLLYWFDPVLTDGTKKTSKIQKKTSKSGNRQDNRGG